MSHSCWQRGLVLVLVCHCILLFWVKVGISQIHGCQLNAEKAQRDAKRVGRTAGGVKPSLWVARLIAFVRVARSAWAERGMEVADREQELTEASEAESRDREGEIRKSQARSAGPYPVC